MVIGVQVAVTFLIYGVFMRSINPSALLDGSVHYALLGLALASLAGVIFLLRKMATDEGHRERRESCGRAVVKSPSSTVPVVDH